MEPVMLIEVLDPHRRIQARHRLTGAGTICKIGRSLACDIVLDDAHAAGEHTQVTLLDDGRVAIADLGSRNGTRLNGNRVAGDTPTIIEDGQLIVGRTHLRIRTAHTLLAPERLFRRDILQRHRTALAVIGLLSTLAYVIFDQWIAAPEQLAAKIFTTSFAALIVIGVWIGLWALITRVGHGAWTLRTHIGIAGIATALVFWIDWLIGVALFATQWQPLWTVNILIAVATVIGALYLHLRKATHLTSRVAICIAALLPLVLGGGAAWIDGRNNASDVNRTSLGSDVYPPTMRLVHSTDLSAYLASVNSVKREASSKRRESLADMPLAEPGQ